MGSHAVGLRAEHGTATLQAATVRQIIVQAYAVQRVLVIGGPTWVRRRSVRYACAKSSHDPDAAPAEVRTMLQNLLADRFKLSVHRATKEITVYSLTIGRNGSKLSAPPADQPSNVVIDDRGAIVFQNATLCEAWSTR